MKNQKTIGFTFNLNTKYFNCSSHIYKWRIPYQNAPKGIATP